MKLPKTKFEKAVNPKEVRSYIADAHFDGKRLLATNGHIMVVIPVEAEEGDVAGPVPSEAVKQARTAKVDSIVLDKDKVVAGGVIFPRENKGKYPDVDQVIKGAASGTSKPDLVLNAKLMHDVALGLCTDAKYPIINVWFKRDEEGKIDKKAPLRVESAKGSDDGFGLIMPCGKT